jgi:magnesium-transporting ATPase (P-type)
MATVSNTGDALPAERERVVSRTVTLGLSTEETGRRLKIYGENRIEERRRRRTVLDLLNRFRNPLVLVLMAAAVLSAVQATQPVSPSSS